MWLCLYFWGSRWQAEICHFAHHLDSDKCDDSPKMIIAFSWKSTQVCLHATCMLQHIAHAVLEHLEKAVQGPSISLVIVLPRGHQMACYFLLSTACHQQRKPICWKWCSLEISQQATDVRFMSVEGLASFLQCSSAIRTEKVAILSYMLLLPIWLAYPACPRHLFEWEVFHICKTDHLVEIGILSLPWTVWS